MTVNGRSKEESPEGVITGAVEAVRNRPAFLRVMFVPATTVVKLVGMRLAAPVLNRFLFAAVSSPLASLDYSWPKRRGIPTVE